MTLTIHEEIESWLAAAVHGELDAQERAHFEQHLASCAECRGLHQEEMIMNKLMTETMSETRPDPTFENRMLAGFREKAPAHNRGAGVILFLVRMVQLRATQFAAAAAVLLTLVQVGKVLTHESMPIAGAAGIARRYENSKIANLPSSEGVESGKQPIPQAATAQSSSADSATSTTLYGAAKRNDQSASSHIFKDLAAPRAQPRASNDLGLGEAADTAFGGKIIGRYGSGDVLSGKLGEARENKSNRRRDLDELEKSSSGIRSRDEKLKAAAQQPTAPANGPVAVASEPAAEPAPSAPAVPAADARKLIRNATLELVVTSYDSALQQITRMAADEHGFIVTNSSSKLANGKLQGTIVVKLLPEHLDAFLLAIRPLGELKNQTLGVQDVTKSYFDTDARLRNARRMEERLVDMLEKNTGRVSDLLQVEKELGRVREQIEQMQGELKYLDAQVQYATVTVTLAEKDLNQPAAFLLKEHANLSLFSPDVEKAFADANHAAELAKAQVLQSKLDRDGSGQVSGRLSLMVAPNDAESLIARIKAIGRVQTFTIENERVAQGGTGTSYTARVERDKVELNIVISHDEQARKQVTLGVVTKQVEQAFEAAKTAALQNSGEIVSSNLTHQPQGSASGRVSVRVPAGNYEPLLESYKKLGRTSNFTVQRDDQNSGEGANENAPVLVSLTLTNEDVPVQQTSLRIESQPVDEKVRQLKANAAQAGAEVRSSTFAREPDGSQAANVTLRVPMKNYSALVASFDQLGKVRDLRVRRQERAEDSNADETAPAEISIQMFSQGKVVPDEKGITATLRRTLGQGFAALMWSVRMIAVALSFIAPWAAALALVTWLLTRLRRARRKRREHD